MKKLALIVLSAVFALTGMAADSFIFSADGKTAGSGRRLLPSQGVDQKTGRIVLGLAAQTDEVRGACGWYRVLPAPEVSSNEVFRCTNYVFNANGTCSQIGEIKQKPRYKTVTSYSKLRLYAAACKLNGWNTLKEYLQNTNTEDGMNLYEAWMQAKEFDDNYPAFNNALSAVRQILMLDEVTFKAILKDCESGTRKVLIDENGNEVPDSERFLPRARRFR